MRRCSFKIQKVLEEISERQSARMREIEVIRVLEDVNDNDVNDY